MEIQKKSSSHRIVEQSLRTIYNTKAIICELDCHSNNLYLAFYQIDPNQNCLNFVFAEGSKLYSTRISLGAALPAPLYLGGIVFNFSTSA